MLGKRPEKRAGVQEYAVELAQNLYDVHTRVQEIYESMNEDRVMANENMNWIQFNIGEEVLLFDPTTPEGLSRKLVQRWKGPYIVLEKMSPTVYTIIESMCLVFVSVPLSMKDIWMKICC